MHKNNNNNNNNNNNPMRVHDSFIRAAEVMMLFAGQGRDEIEGGLGNDFIDGGSESDFSWFVKQANNVWKSINYESRHRIG